MRCILWPERRAVLAVPLLFIGCAGRQSASTEVEVQTDAGSVASQSLNQVVLVGPLRLQNPTAASTSIDGASWHAVIDDAAGKVDQTGELALSVTAAPGQEGRGELRVELPLPATAEVLSAHKESPSLSWQLTATLKVKGAKGLEEYEAEWFGNLYPSKAPELTVEAEAARSENHLELRFFVGVSNPNPFPMTVSGLTYDLKVQDVAVAKGDLVQDRKLDPASGWELEIQRVIGKDDLKDLAKTLLKRKTIPYSIAATMRVGDVSWDMPFSGEIKFE